MSNSKGAIILVALAMAIWAAGAFGCNRGTTANMGEQEMTAQKTASPVNTTINGAVRYVALGDSTGSGVGARDGGYVARLFRKILANRNGSTLTNLCFSGATTSDVLRSQLDRAIAAQPNLVTVGIGINDIGHGLTVEEFAHNYESILTRLKEGTRATIVLSNIPDISSAPRIPPTLRNEYQRIIMTFNDKVNEIAARHGVAVFDVYGITHKDLPSHPEYFSADGFHPSDEGYELWADHMWPTIARVIGVDATQRYQR